MGFAVWYNYFGDCGYFDDFSRSYQPIGIYLSAIFV